MLETDRAAYREQARWSLAGVPYPQETAVSWQLSDAERRERFEKAWAAGDLVHILTQLWADQGVDVDGNALVGELIREKIRAIVKDPETAAALSPHDHPFGAKRPCLDTNYYATYNRPNVTLVNLRQEPIKAITASGITTDKRSVRRRRDRVRHRLRRHDRRDHGGASDHRPRRQVAVRRLGRRAADLSRAHRRRLPQPVHDHRPGQPVGAVEHGGVDRAARRLGGRPADCDCARPASRQSRRPRRRRPAGRGTWPTVRC